MVWSRRTKWIRTPPAWEHFDPGARRHRRRAHDRRFNRPRRREKSDYSRPGTIVASLLAGTLQDPVLELRMLGTLMAVNDDWGNSTRLRTLWPASLP